MTEPGSIELVKNSVHWANAAIQTLVGERNAHNLNTTWTHLLSNRLDVGNKRQPRANVQNLSPWFLS